MPPKQKNSPFSSSFWSTFQNPFIIVLTAITFLFYCSIFYLAFQEEKSLIPLTMATLILGLIYQSYKITQSTEKILIYLVISSFLSLLAFGQGENETVYVLSVHLEIWIYYFLAIFLIIMSVQHDKKITTPFGEGLSLLFCLAFLYWLFENYLFDFSFILTQVLSMTVLSVTAFSVIHALFKIKHNSVSRFILSISTCIAIVVLSLDNLFQLIDQGEPSFNKSLFENLILLTQYFLLGISALFLFQNIMLLLQYMPSKYTRSYFSDIKENTQSHIERFSKDQISWMEASLCLFISTFAYTLNYYFQIIPPNMCIWLVIFLCPLLIQYLFVQPIPKVVENPLPLKTHSTNPNKRRVKRKRKK